MLKHIPLSKTIKLTLVKNCLLDWIKCCPVKSFLFVNIYKILPHWWSKMGWKNWKLSSRYDRKQHLEWRIISKLPPSVILIKGPDGGGKEIHKVGYLITLSEWAGSRNKHTLLPPTASYKYPPPLASKWNIGLISQRGNECISEISTLKLVLMITFHQEFCWMYSS